MKKISILLLFPLLTNAQFFNQDFLKINNENEKKARRFLIKCQSTNIFSCLKNSIKNKKTKYYTVASYYLSKNAVLYDDTEKIVNFLVLSNNTLDDFIALKEVNGDFLFQGCDNGIINENDEYYYLEGMKKVGIKDTTTVTLNNSWVWNKVLKGRQFDFLFSVKYFRNAIWFIENKKIYLVDMKELKVYDPDEYIRQKCSIETIHKLAQNKVNRFCD
jgi:hypothetical protein